MRLVCKKNTFKKTKTIGLGPFKRDESYENNIPLTIGKSYEVSLIKDSGAVKGNYLLVFTDNLKWEEISPIDVLLVLPSQDPHVGYNNYAPWDELIQEVFENPTIDENLNGKVEISLFKKD